MSRKFGQFRLPVIKTPADVETLAHLSKEEKEYGTRNLKMVPQTDGWLMLGNDPDLQAFWQIMERTNTSLLFPDFQITPFSPMHLINMIIGKRGGNDYLMGVMTTFSIEAIEVRELGNEYLTKLNMLDYPDSAVWTDEERMTIKFINAAIDNTMTDELFDQALATWGEKKLLRHISWISFVQGWSMLLNILDMKYERSMAAPKGAMSPKVVETVTTNLKDTKERVREFWASLVEFKE